MPARSGEIRPGLEQKEIKHQINLSSRDAERLKAIAKENNKTTERVFRDAVSLYLTLRAKVGDSKSTMVKIDDHYLELGAFLSLPYKDEK